MASLLAVVTGCQLVPWPGIPVECVDIPAERCPELDESNLRDIDPQEVDRFVVTCNGECTPQQGTATVDVIRRDGTRVTLSRTFWVGESP